MFVVMGATGQTGSAVVEELLSKGRKVRAYVRDAAKAAGLARRGVDLAVGEATDIAALTRAFAGAEAAYVMVPPSPTHPDPVAFYAEVAEAVRAAAIAAKLPKIVLLSSVGAQHEAGTGPIAGLHRVEEILKGAVPTLVVVRAGYFHENWATVAAATAGGVLPTFLADVDKPVPTVATIDIGRTAAAALMDGHAQPLVAILGPRDDSARDAAAAFAAALGRPVMPVVPPRAEWTGILVGAGLSEAYAAALAEMYEGIISGHVALAGDEVVLRGTTSLAESVRRLAVPRAA